MSNSEEELLAIFNKLSLRDKQPVISKMDPEQIQAIVQNAVAGALAAQQMFFDQRLQEVVNNVNTMNVKPVPPVMRSYEEVELNRAIYCEEGLDGIKSVPPFSGEKKSYLSFRRAAFNAFKLFEGFEGSPRYHQALTIFRNKILGKADDLLSSHNTVFNFHAIVARLDFEYSDKRPIYLLEQELSTLRQGNMSVVEYYDQVEIKLTSLTNKALMTYDSEFANKLNDKYRNDALRVFISGLKKSLSDTLFASRPLDLPSALALAEELEGNRERYVFAASFRQGDTKGIGPAAASSVAVDNKGVSRVNNKPNRDQSRPEAMDVDPSLRTQLGGKSAVTLSKQSRQQNLNYIAAHSEDAALEVAVSKSYDELVDELEVEDSINFLGGNPCYHI